jgi:uncharacterized membrane protein
MDYKKIVITGVVLVAIDVLFLYFITPIFNKMIHNIQGSNINIKYMPLMFVYLFVTLQIYYFIIRENKGLLDAFILGMTTYAIFDLTNLSVFKNYNSKIAIVDIIWGGILYTSTTYIVSKLLTQPTVPQSAPRLISKGKQNFIAAAAFIGAKPGYVFTTRDSGVGYYVDNQ